MRINEELKYTHVLKVDCQLNVNFEFNIYPQINLISLHC